MPRPLTPQTFVNDNVGVIDQTFVGDHISPAVNGIS